MSQSSFLVALSAFTLTACTTPVDPATTGAEPDEALVPAETPAETAESDNAWPTPLAEAPADLVGTGTSRGDTAHDFTFIDQNGDEVSLYQFYGHVIVLDVFAQWCEPCAEAAPHNESFWAEYKDQGVIVLAGMEENNAGSSPGVGDLSAWADSFALTHPVLADPDYALDAYVKEGYPTLVVIDQTMKIVEPDMWPVDFDRVASLLE